MNNQTLQMMRELKLPGMHNTFETVLNTKPQGKITPDELIHLLVQAEWDDRQQRRLERLTSRARFRYQSSVEEISFPDKRNLDKNTFIRLSDCSFIDRKESILITGPTGVGKSFIATALGLEACRKGYETKYYSAEKLFHHLNISKADGTYAKELARLERLDLLIIDDFGLMPLDLKKRMDLMEIIEDRHSRSGTIICSQLPVNKWYEIIEDSTIADAILDRLVNNSHRLELKGESLRRKK